MPVRSIVINKQTRLQQSGYPIQQNTNKQTQKGLLPPVHEDFQIHPGKGEAEKAG